MYKRIIVICLTLAIAAATLACGETEQTTNETDSQSTTAATDSFYDSLDEDYDGYEFTIFNAATQFNCYIRLDFEEQTGETLDDAVYERNSLIEDKLNCVITEYQFDGGTDWGTMQQNTCSHITQMVMAGDCDYDAAYLPVSFQPGVVTGGYLTDLYPIPELQYGEEWWDNVINDSLTINGKLYTASSPLHFMSLDLAWVLLFNQDKMDELAMEYPYDLVREGKWTLDKFNEYITGVANLNGDSSFTWDPDGSAVYGIAEHTDSPTAFIYSAGNQLLERDGDTFKFVGDTERMYNTVDKLRSLFNVSSGNAYQSNAAMETQSGYLYAFSVDRALFITCELKATLELRDMNSTFGLLPLPKYDESQPDYITSVNHITAFLTIPVTQPDMSRAGTILNALTYESWKSVLPIYYDVSVSQKGLRNDDSIEMLDIVRSNRGVQFSEVFGITTELSTSIQTVVNSNQDTIASTIAAGIPKVEENLANVLEAFE